MSEIIQLLSKSEARELTDRIKGAGAELAAMIHRAYHGEAWSVLGYKDWEEYIRIQFNMTDRHSYRLIDFEDIKRTLNSDQLVTPPNSESQVRPLKGLQPSQQREAWQEAQEIAGDAPVTAKHVEAAVERVQSGEPKAERIHFKPSNGMQYAELAISNLKKIQPNDTERKAAFNKVLKFIQSSL
jgi:hypothetical protein